MQIVGISFSPLRYFDIWIYCCNWRNEINKIALITGASSGIGAAFARQLAAEGYRLILHGRREERLKALIRELQDSRIQLVLGDLMEDSTLDRLIAAGKKAGINLLINNAGYGLGKDFFADNLENQLSVLTVHCRVPVILCRELIPGMLERGSGQVINVSSLEGEHRVPKDLMYASSKSFLTIFSETLALKLRERNVFVQALLPGFTVSEFLDRIPEWGVEKGKWVNEKSTSAFLRWQRAEDVVALSLRMIRKKKPKIIVIPGFSNRFLTTLTRLIGKRFYRYLAKKI